MKLFNVAELGNFKLWFGWGFPPILLGALVITYFHSVPIGLGASAVLLAWFYESGRTTCSRCAYYGTSKCGLPGLIAPFLTERKSAASLPLEQVRSHMRLDMAVILFINALYAIEPWYLPLALVWTVGAWRISLGPKRHHRLLARLRSSPAGKGLPTRRIPITPAPK
jgi:hypothetical protein